MFEKTVMENGVRVLTEKMLGVRSLSIGILVAASIRDEKPSQSGIAHFTEHMMFQGTSGRDSLEIARMIDESGGQMGAFTSRDYTFYQFSVLDDFATYALDLLGDILLYSTFPQESMEREKNVILREIDAANDDPSDRAHTLMKQNAWPNHPLGRIIAGTHETVKEFTREDLIYFVHDHYLPNRLIVSAAGNVEHADFAAQTRDALWRIIGEAPMPESTEPEFKKAVVVEHMPVSLVYFAIGIKAGAHANSDRYLYHIFNEVLGGGYSSRLFNNIREKKGLVYSLTSAYHAYMEGGMLVIEGATSPDNIEEVIKLTLDEIRRLIDGTEPVSPDELVKVKSQLIGKHLIASENSHTRMGALANQEFYFGRHIRSDEIVSSFDNIRIEDIENFGKSGFLNSFENLSLAVVGPEAPEHYDKTKIEKTLEAFQ